MSKEGLAIVVITHDINFAAEHASRVVIINNGKILLDGEPHTVLSQEETLHSANLEPPGSVRLSMLLGLTPMLTVEEIIKALQSGNGAGG
jgi:energy-coupling factor transport system ATP-binding protein